MKYEVAVLGAYVEEAGRVVYRRGLLDPLPVGRHKLDEVDALAVVHCAEEMRLHIWCAWRVPLEEAEQAHFGGVVGERESTYRVEVIARSN